MEKLIEILLNITDRKAGIPNNGVTDEGSLFHIHTAQIDELIQHFYIVFLAYGYCQLQRTHLIVILLAVGVFAFGLFRFIGYL